MPKRKKVRRKDKNRFSFFNHRTKDFMPEFLFEPILVGRGNYQMKIQGIGTSKKTGKIAILYQDIPTIKEEGSFFKWDGKKATKIKEWTFKSKPFSPEYKKSHRRVNVK